VKDYILHKSSITYQNHKIQSCNGYVTILRSQSRLNTKLKVI